MLGNTKEFKKIVKTSFTNVRAEMQEVKKAVTDWILYLDSNQRDLQLRVHELEKQVAQLKKGRAEEKVIELWE